MPGLLRAAYRKKIAGYFHACKQDKFQETWGFDRMRVLTITTSDARIDHMLELLEEA